MANIASLFFSLIFPALTVGLLILKLVQFANLEALQRKSVLIPIIAGILQLLWLVFAGYFYDYNWSSIRGSDLLSLSFIFFSWGIYAFFISVLVARMNSFISGAIAGLISLSIFYLLAGLPALFWILKDSNVYLYLVNPWNEPGIVNFFAAPFFYNFRIIFDFFQIIAILLGSLIGTGLRRVSRQ